MAMYNDEGKMVGWVENGWMVKTDCGGSGPALTPADWGLEAIVNGMGSDVQVTETLVDTIEEE